MYKMLISTIKKEDFLLSKKYYEYKKGLGNAHPAKSLELGKSMWRHLCFSIEAYNSMTAKGLNISF
jgi:hypothetical protein